ncbi:MAG: RhuM family protein [bacterium]|nr:RhuM family protein [bacterium]
MEKKEQTKKGEIVIYEASKGEARVEVHLEKETVWLDAHQIALVFGVNRPAIVKHINNIYRTGELNKSSTCSILEQVAADGKVRQMNIYNLDMIISVGYRINSGRATQFASFLENCEDIISYAKNYFAVHFKIDYKNASGSISDYYPDYIVKVSPQEYYVVEIKGREDINDVEKIKRLAQWCVDVNANQKNVVYKMLYIRQEEWEAQQQKPRNFQEVVRNWIKK